MKKILLLTAMCMLGLFTVKAQDSSETSNVEVITIGGDSPQFINNLPYNCWYGNSLSQQIYTKEEIDFMNGDVTKVAFMQRTTASYTRDLVIYMLNTEKEYFTGWYDWAELSTSDIVFEGQVTTTTADTWLEIELQNNFYYEGGNLLLCVQDNTNSYDNWFEFSVFETDTVNRTLVNARDSKPYDINNLTESDGAAGNLTTLRSSVQFTIEYQEGLSVFPQEIALGDIQLGEYWPEKEEASASVTVFSGGVAITSITCDNDFFTLPENIDLTSEPVTFDVGYDKEAEAGEYTGIITIANADGETVEVALSATTYTPVEPDVFELATEITFTDGTFTATPDFATLHDDYLLPNETKDNVAPDAVYTFTLENEKIIDVNIDGTNGNYAIYKAENIGDGNGPKADNNDKGVEIILGTTFSFNFDDNATDDFYTIDYDEFKEYNWGIENGSLISYSYAYYFDENDEYHWINAANERVITNESYAITPKTVLTFDAARSGWGQEAVIVEVTKDGEEFFAIQSVIVNDPMSDWAELDARVDIGAIFTNKGLEFGDYQISLHHNISGIGYIKIDNLEMKEIAGVYAAGDYYLVAAAKDAFSINMALEDVAVEVPAPSNVTAEATGSNSIVLSWDAVEGAIYYGVYVDGEWAIAVDATALSHEFTGLEPETTYCFTVITITEVNEQGIISVYSEESEEACATTDPIGVAEISSKFNIHPNPVNDVLFIESGENVEQVTIYNMTGVMVHDMECGMQNVELSVSDLDGGVYVVKVRTENNEVISRFIKK